MWNQLAKNWDTPGVSLGENDLKIIERTKKYLDASSVILDYGCVTGSIAIEIASIAREVRGIDISSNMIEIAKRKMDERRIKNIAYHGQCGRCTGAGTSRAHGWVMVDLHCHGHCARRSACGSYGAGFARAYCGDEVGLREVGRLVDW